MSTKQIEATQAARNANRDGMGRIKNRALDLRLQAEERRLAIETLGWAPEKSQRYEDRYAATTGEMLKWLAEKTA